MKEQGRKFLEDLRESDSEIFEQGWKNSKFSKLKSLVEVGIDPKTKFDSLWQETEYKCEPYKKYLEQANFTYDETQKIWGLLQTIGGITIDLTIEDLLGLKDSDLEGITSYDKTEKRILTRLFASPLLTDR